MYVSGSAKCIDALIPADDPHFLSRGVEKLRRIPDGHLGGPGGWAVLGVACRVDELAQRVAQQGGSGKLPGDLHALIDEFSIFLLSHARSPVSASTAP